MHEYEVGGVMEVILPAFRQCGYNVEWKVVNAGGDCSTISRTCIFLWVPTGFEVPSVGLVECGAEECVSSPSIHSRIQL